MRLRFDERKPAASGNLLPIVLLVVSLALYGVYTLEGAGGPLHTVQGAVSVLTSPLRAAGTGLQSIATSASVSLEDSNAAPETLSQLREQNEQLRQQVAELEEYRQTAIRLEGIQKLRDTYSVEGVTCHVVSVSGESWNRIVTIDKGSADGIAIGLAVTGPTGLVGQVKSVTADSAEVRLLQDPDSGVAVIVQSSRAEGLLKGNIDGLLYLEGISADAEVKVGDVIITSGTGGGYFRGLMVGTVVRIDEGGGQAVRRIIVAPNDTASALEELMVVTGIGSEGALDESLSLDDGQAPTDGGPDSADGPDDAGYEPDDGYEDGDETSYGGDFDEDWE